MFTPFYVSVLVFSSLVLAIPFLKWIYLPIKIRNTFPTPIKPDFEPTTLEQLTPEMRDLIGEYLRQFSNEGFTVGANMVTNRGAGQPRAAQVVLINRASGDIGILIFATVQLHRNCVLSIRSVFEDGRELITVCNQNIGFLPKDPAVDSVTFSWVRDVATLAEAHRRRLHQLDLDSRKHPVPADAWEYAVERYKQETARFAICGYYWRDEKAGIFRKTWKGTFLSVWKLMQPVKGWRMRSRDRRSRKLWNELGVDRWVPVNSIPFDSTAELPPQSVESAPDPAKSVSYQTLLASGELRVSQEPGVTIVRLGKPSKTAYLGIRWATLSWIVFDAMLLLSMSLQLWFLYRSGISPGIPFQMYLYGPLICLACMALFLILSARSLFNGLVRVGGTSIVSASHAGLHFEDAPSRRRSGFIKREDIRNLVITQKERHLFTSIYLLESLIADERTRQPLLVCTRKVQLIEASKTLAFAMGIQT